MPLLLLWKIKFGLKIQRMLGEIIEFFIIKQIKKLRLCCSVVKHLGSGRALKKWGKTLDCVSCFPLHFFRALPLPKCFTIEQSTVEASLFVKYMNTCKWLTLILKHLTFLSIKLQYTARLTCI